MGSGSFWLLPRELHTGLVAVRERDAGSLESLLEHDKGGVSRLSRPRFELSDCNNSNFGGFCELPLRPIEKSARGAALSWCHEAFSTTPDT
jgi:hypothetical protein